MRHKKLDGLSPNALKREYLKNGILPKWHSKTLKEFTNDSNAKAKVEKYLKDAYLMKQKGIGLFLWGANGTGKTHLMTSAFKLLLEEGHSAKVISLSSLIAKFTAGWYDATEKRELQDILKKVEFLGIEEIGKEFRSKNSDLGTVVFDNILRYRVQMQKPTWFTSNVNPKNLTANYTEDITSMLKECCYPLQVLGSDKRDREFKKIKGYFEDDTAL